MWLTLFICLSLCLCPSLPLSLSHQVSSPMIRTSTELMSLAMDALYSCTRFVLLVLWTIQIEGEIENQCLAGFFCIKFAQLFFFNLQNGIVISFYNWKCFMDGVYPSPQHKRWKLRGENFFYWIESGLEFDFIFVIKSSVAN